MSNYLVVSTSGNPDSNSRRMGQAAFDWLKKANLSCEWMDISKLNLPLCDADACYNDPAAQNLTTAIEKSDGIIIATPVYNYDVSAAAKNMVELTGSAWEDKVVAFLCAAGGMSSYMSVMSFANSLMLDFRCLIIPRFVYATGHSFDGDRLTDDKLAKRIERVAADLVRVTKAVRG
ncbi:MAG: flavoprotein [Verrucomicrobia bacterium]|nr:MAG: flavoprotein [Verrucomicrobiota bacterium]